MDDTSISEPTDSLPNFKDHWFGIGIARVTEDYNHCGVVYFDLKAGENKILHLAWHNKLLLQSIPKDKYRWVKLTEFFDEDNARDFANMCKWIYDTNKNHLPYAVNFDGALIDQATNLIDFSNGESVGLTCSSFSMLVFERFGLSLVDSKTWKTRDSDEDWHRLIVDALRRSRIEEEHVNIVEKEIPCSRIRPEEIASSCSIENKPADFESVQAPSLKVHSELRT